VTIRDLVRNSLRMRPDRIVVGEVRGAEALDMLQSMNTGHDGSLTTVHANSPRDALSRIETMVLMAGFDLPLRAIRQQIASALELLVHIERLHDGTRRVTAITEVQRMEQDVITLQDLFTFRVDAVASNKERTVVGTLESTGLRPMFLEKFEHRGIPIPAKLREFSQAELSPLRRAR
jgi:pilus assembly protein CpaF